MTLFSASNAAGPEKEIPMHSNPEASPEVRLLTVGEVADRLSLSRARVYELVMGGSIQSVKIGYSRRISTEALAAFVRQLEVAV